MTPAHLNTFFASLPTHSLVRFWAFEGTMAVNATTHQIDWQALDNVFAAAAAHHQLLLPAITAQGGDCDDGHWQDPSWYEGGFTQVFENPTAPDATPLAPLSYWEYLQAIVARYRTSPALGMWEPISEPEASTCPAQYQPFQCSGHQTCPDEAAAAQALRYFFDRVGEEIHQLDPRHLVESGTLGGGQCGTEGSDYAYVSASPGLDVLAYHDYYGAGPLIGGDQWNGIGVRIDQAAELGKPIIGGEMGYNDPGGA
jgi:mannan endo-1,4-beta-mannosidase